MRESIRKPYVIANYLYANSLYNKEMPGDGGFTVDKVTSAGVLKSARWIETRELTKENQVEVGKEIFRVECMSCHTPSGYHGVRQYVEKRNWDDAKIHAMMGGLNFMHNGVMPGFAGTDAEREALAAYVSSIAPKAMASAGPADGRVVYEQNCGMCHQVKVDDHLFTNMPKDKKAAMDAMKDLTGLFPLMPDLKLNDQQRLSLAGWVNEQRAAHGIAAPKQGGN